MSGVIDPAYWAYAQVQAMIGDFLDSWKDGKFRALRDWIIECCSGPWRIPDHSVIDLMGALTSRLLRTEWRAPMWLLAFAYAPPPNEYPIDAPAWEEQSEEKTEKILDRLCTRFWKEIDTQLARRAKRLRTDMAERTDGHSRDGQRALSDFDRLAGQLVCITRSSKGARLDDVALRYICAQLDAAGFVPRKHVEGKSRKAIADWNQKHPTMPIHTFSAGIEAKGARHFVRRAIRRALSRARTHYEESHFPRRPAN